MSERLSEYDKLYNGWKTYLKAEMDELLTSACATNDGVASDLMEMDRLGQEIAKWEGREVERVAEELGKEMKQEITQYDSDPYARLDHLEEPSGPTEQDLIISGLIESCQTEFRLIQDLKRKLYLQKVKKQNEELQKAIADRLAVVPLNFDV